MNLVTTSSGPYRSAISESRACTETTSPVGDPYDNAVVESFWGRMQVELLNRQRWRTRVELANAIFEYIEGFHNRHRRHSALGWISPLEFETEHRNRATTPHEPLR
jgi:putative transposase